MPSKVGVAGRYVVMALVILGILLALPKALGVALSGVLVFLGVGLGLSPWVHKGLKKFGRQDALLAVAMVGLGVLSLWLLSVPTHSAVDSAAQAGTATEVASQTSGQTYIAGPGYIGCQTQEDVQFIVRVAAQGNRDAYAQAVQKSLSAGLCRELPAGEPVEREDFTGSGLTQVRIAGEASSWWTPIEATESR